MEIWVSRGVIGHVIIGLAISDSPPDSPLPPTSVDDDADGGATEIAGQDIVRPVSECTFWYISKFQYSATDIFINIIDVYNKQNWP